jgi:hypothetical protein
MHGDEAWCIAPRARIDATVTVGRRQNEEW